MDSLIGVPLIILFYILGLKIFKKSKLIEKKKVAILVFGAIGDAVLARSITDNLELNYPKTRITVYLSNENAAAKFLFQKFDVRILKITNLFSNLIHIRKEDFDIWIDTSQWARIGAIYSFLSGSRYSIGFQTDHQYRHYLYDHQVHHSNVIHEIENFNHLLNPFGIKVFGLPHETLENTNPNINLSNNSYIVLHLIPSGYLSHLREWPTGSWIELINNLINQGYEVVLTGSKQDKQKILEIFTDTNVLDHVKVIAGECSLVETCHILKKAFCVISVNTSIIHLASLMGVKIISLNGPTNSIRWGAWGAKSINLDVPKELGGGFLNLGFEYPKNPQNVMCFIQVNQVLEAINKFG